MAAQFERRNASEGGCPQLTAQHVLSGEPSESSSGTRGERSSLSFFSARRKSSAARPGHRKHLIISIARPRPASAGKGNFGTTIFEASRTSQFRRVVSAIDWRSSRIRTVQHDSVYTKYS